MGRCERRQGLALTEAQGGQAVSQGVLPVSEDGWAKWLPVQPCVVENNKTETKEKQERKGVRKNLYY